MVDVDLQDKSLLQDKETHKKQQQEEVLSEHNEEGKLCEEKQVESVGSVGTEEGVKEEEMEGKEADGREMQEEKKKEMKEVDGDLREEIKVEEKKEDEKEGIEIDSKEENKEEEEVDGVSKEKHEEMKELKEDTKEEIKVEENSKEEKEVDRIDAHKELNEDVKVEHKEEIKVENEKENQKEKHEDKEVKDVIEEKNENENEEIEKNKENQTKQSEDLERGTSEGDELYDDFPTTSPPQHHDHSSPKGNQPIVGTKVDEHHKNYVLMYVMLLGIRTTLSRCHSRPSRPLKDDDFPAANKIAFDITGAEMTPFSKYDFKFKDYSPWVFRSLREIFKLDAADYLVSLTGRYVLSELGSPGKSGSFFYFSQDYRFIIKTISHTEHKFFRKILKHYHDYVLENPNTLIARYYGLHRVKLPRGSKIHFVVMGNVFPPNRDIHQTYDLKGSTLGRFVQVTEEQIASGKKVLKDLNFKRQIKLGPEKRKQFFDQIQKDSQFLASMNIMDYSLLLGIHDMTRGNSEQIRNRSLTVFEPPKSIKISDESVSKQQRKALKKAISKSGLFALDPTKSKLPNEPTTERKNCIFYSDEGGYQATDENNLPLDEMYHMGIIDILTPYNGIKKIETTFKSINHDPKQISAIPPPQYATRFVDFLIHKTTGGSSES